MCDDTGRRFGSRERRRSRIRLSLALLVTFLSVAVKAGAATLSNEEFCSRTANLLADSLIIKLGLNPSDSVTIAPIEGRFGQVMLDRMGAKLGELGVTAYLLRGDEISKRAIVQTAVDDYHLSYEGVGRGLFSRGDVARFFSIGGYCRLLESDGRLLRSSNVKSLVVGDTLSYEEARRARGRDRFLSPELPPSVYQRLVEPGLIVGITGALVYLFFASR